MILVTGGYGFIGSNFIQNWLTKHDEPVLNIDKLTYAGNENNLSSLKNDKRCLSEKVCITDQAALSALIEEHQPRAIVHFAAETHVDRSIEGPEVFVQTNVMGTYRLLEAARIFWSHLPEPKKSEFKFIHISTDEVYGSLEKEDPAFSETTRYAPNSPYSASKAASDHFARAYFHTYEMPVIITNCSNNYGPRQFPEKLIPLFIKNALSGKKLPIYGNGENVRDWLYVDDHCNAINKVLSSGRPGEVYNIGGMNEMKNIDVVDIICETLDRLQPRADGKSFKEQKAFVTDRPGHDKRYAIDISKINKELGWKPQESFQTGIVKTVEWYLKEMRA